MFSASGKKCSQSSTKHFKKFHENMETEILTLVLGYFIQTLYEKGQKNKLLMCFFSRPYSSLISGTISAAMAQYKLSPHFYIPESHTLNPNPNILTEDDKLSPCKDDCKSFMFWSSSCEGKQPDGAGTADDEVLSPSLAEEFMVRSAACPKTAVHSLLNSPSSREEALRISFSNTMSSLSPGSGSKDLTNVSFEAVSEQESQDKYIFLHKVKKELLKTQPIQARYVRWNIFARIFVFFFRLNSLGHLGLYLCNK